ncbi:hypothetical protein A6J71_00060 [Enterobacter cancerogenus]|uniref:winged helix-turn-helix domain-containing protein n=1 Tax=Enterobacter cancerogenus TaxID=69218 RepID=UPI000C9C7ECD|nr:winged helix-turn-helix domain-containing protein [Enterobacter cancerogenus]PNF13470.1 hypothetical protein A6J71_00060 [Enterobacter cancerogenus]
MIVVIEKIVVFNSIDCRLSNVQTADDITITLLHSQLLELLIRYQGFAVSRNEIFDKIFDVNGAHTTNNNLNQNISILRKHLLHLGITDEVITTVTRVGFMIRDSILIEISDNGAAEEQFSFTQVPVNNLHILKRTKRKFFFGTTLIAITLLFLFMLHKGYKIAAQLKPDNLPLLSYKQSKDFLGCKVNKLSARGAGDDYFSDEKFYDIISNLKCDSPQNTEFYISRNTILDNNFRGFTLKCIRTTSGQYDCYSFYESVEVD